MKTLREIGIILMSAFMMAGLAACGNDEENGKEGFKDLKAYTECPDNHHPHLIDLGLPSGTKWACCNIGASQPEDYGEYFAWGETENMTSHGTNDFHQTANNICGTNRDVARVKWGSPWRMPTKEEINELLKDCTHEQTQLNDIKGIRVTGPNGKSIFLSFAGYGSASSSHNEVGTRSYYWSGELSPNIVDAYALYLNGWRSDRYYRLYYYSVRPVAK